MADHLLSHIDLFSPNYREAAENALHSLETAFGVKFERLKDAYKAGEISHSDLITARNALLQEAATILRANPGETPAEILFKLRHHAVCHERSTLRFSAIRYIARLLRLDGGNPLGPLRSSFFAIFF